MRVILAIHIVVDVFLLVYIACKLEMICQQQRFICAFIHDKNMILNFLERDLIEGTLPDRYMIDQPLTFTTNLGDIDVQKTT